MTGTTPTSGKTLTQRAAEFVCSDWRGPNVVPSHGAYTCQVAERLGITMKQARGALSRAEARGWIVGNRAPWVGETIYWSPENKA